MAPAAPPGGWSIGSFMRRRVDERVNSVNSVDSANDSLDKHLKSPDFFDAKEQLPMC